MKKMVLAPALLAMFVSLLLFPGRAEAYDDPYVVGLRADNARVAIASNSCRSIPYSVAIGGGADLTDLYANGTVDVWRGSRNVGSDYAYGDVSGGTIDSSYFWCPSLDGLGTFSLRYVEGEWSGVTECYSYDGDGYCESGEDYVSGPLAGGNAGTFTVKQASRFRDFRVARSGTRRTASAVGLWYSVGDSRWRGLPRGTTVLLQKRRADGSSGWVNLKSFRVGSKGVARTNWTTSRRLQYRFVFRGTSRTWNALSTTITR